MNRRKLEKHLREHGCERVYHGGDHDVWMNSVTLARSPVPRHAEINTWTARAICRQLGVPLPAGR